MTLPVERVRESLNNLRAILGVDADIVEEVDGAFPANPRSALEMRRVRDANPPAVPALLIRNICMNAGFGAMALAQDPLLSRLVVANSNISVFAPPYTHRAIGRVTQMLCKVRYAREKTRWTGAADRNMKIQLLAIAELLAPADVACALNEADARAEIISIVKYGLAHDTTGLVPPKNEWFYQGLYGIEDIENPNKVLTIDEAMLILEGWCTSSTAGRDVLSNASLLANTVVAMCKKGAVTEHAADKISDGIKADIGESVVLNPDLAQRIYSVFGHRINAGNAEAYFAALAGSVPAHAIRLTTTITQAAGTGLTTYLVIRRMLEMEPTFPWAVAYEIIPGDFQRYTAAATAINNNQYYGFNRDLGPAAASNFQNLSYLAFNIGIKVHGDKHLGKYGGIPKASLKKVALDALIDAYIIQAALFDTALQTSNVSVQSVINIYNAAFPANESQVLIPRFTGRARTGINATLQAAAPLPNIPGAPYVAGNAAGAAQGGAAGGAIANAAVAGGAGNAMGV